ncbi:tetratricopeptide repeat protein, partial [Myxococcota bacterium]|nr:tetratricopeptide repeat protein [Myxococcota bacterium]
ALVAAQEACRLETEGCEGAHVQALVDVGRGAEAQSLAQAALGRGLDDRALRLAAADAALSTGDAHGASLLLAPLAAEDPAIAASRAYALARAGDTRGAQALAIQAQAQAPEQIDVLLRSAAALLLVGDEPAARVAVESALGLDGSLTVEGGARELFTARAVTLASRGDHERALLYAVQAFVLDPDDGVTSRAVGEAFLRLSEPSRAIPYLERALRSSPYALDETSAGVARASATSLSDEERAAARAVIARELVGAAAAIQDEPRRLAALELLVAAQRPPPVDDLLALSDALLTARRAEESVNALKRAAELGSAEAAARLCRAYLKASRLDEATVWGERAVSLAPDDPAMALTLVEVYRVRGDLRRAQATLDRALARSPDDPRLQEAAKGLKTTVTPQGLPSVFAPR